MPHHFPAFFMNTVNNLNHLNRLTQRLTQRRPTANSAPALVRRAVALALRAMAYTMACIGMLLLASCDKPDPNIETATTGKAEILCDAALMPLMQPTFAMFDSAYPDATVRVKSASAREAMAQLFAGKARGVLIARRYLRDEDSLMKAFKVQPHNAIVLAQDALVLFAKPTFPLDTLSLEQVKAFFSAKSTTLRSFHPELAAEPAVYCPDANSSEYGNMMLLLTGGAAPAHVQTRSSADSVIAAVEAAPNAIGVGYLSQLAGKANVKALKLLKLGFTDSTGSRISPKAVHQSYVVMGKYPLVVPIKGLLLEDRQNLPWGFFTFLRHDNKTKEHLLKSGIVPDNARFNLVPDED
jgi:ABC-type phosphate transport system substrate-binding protein